MAEVKWIKITIDMFEDEKIDFIQSLPEGNALLVIWIRLLTMAGKCNTNGYIFITENIPYTVDALSHKFKSTPTIVKLALDTFVRLGMITIDDQGICLNNWYKYQNGDKLDLIREQNKNRQQRHRDKVKMLPEPEEEHPVISNIDIDLELRADNVINNVTHNVTNETQSIFELLKTVKGYPFDEKKDLEMIQRLKDRYSNIDILKSIQAWAIYKIDAPLETKSKPRSQISTWLEHDEKYGRHIIKDRYREVI